MPIVILCPTADCRVRLTIGDERAGSTFECPRCRTPISVPVLLPPTVPTPAASPTPPPIPRAAPSTDEAKPRKGGRKRAKPSGRFCYDCGREIARGQVRRRDVKVGCSSISGGPGHPGRYASHYGRVDLCKRCADERDRDDLIGCVIVLIILFIICLFLLVKVLD